MKKILIVDDETGWRNFNVSAVREALGNEVEILTSSSAQEAYNLLLENMNNPFDFILTDMQMEDDYAPKLAGEWLVGQIKTLPQYRNAKIVIISASARARYIAEDYGAEFIPKSVAVTTGDAYKTVLEN